MLRKELYQQYKNQSGIYKLTINNKFYIGSAKNIGIRLSKHLLDLERNLLNSECIKLQEEIKIQKQLNLQLEELLIETKNGYEKKIDSECDKKKKLKFRKKWGLDDKKTNETLENK